MCKMNSHACTSSRGGYTFARDSSCCMWALAPKDCDQREASTAAIFGAHFILKRKAEMVEPWQSLLQLVNTAESTDDPKDFV